MNGREANAAVPVLPAVLSEAEPRASPTVGCQVISFDEMLGNGSIGEAATNALRKIAPGVLEREGHGGGQGH